MAEVQGLKVKLGLKDEMSLPMLRFAYEISGSKYGCTQKGFMRWLNRDWKERCGRQ